MSNRIIPLIAPAVAIAMVSLAAGAATSNQTGTKGFSQNSGGGQTQSGAQSQTGNPPQGGNRQLGAKQQPGNNQKQPHYKTSHFGKWDVRCPKKKSQGMCEMTQLVKNPSNHQPIMRVVMGYPPQAHGAAMIFVTPLGTRLAPGITLKADGGKSHHVPFQICLKQGCRADYPIRGNLKNEMKHGQNAHVQIISPRGQKINLKVSLQGFTAANHKIHSSS